MITPWIQARTDEFLNLKSTTVNRWHAIEMALWENSADGTVKFRDPTVPFIQCLTLYLEFSARRTLAIGTYQSEANGLWSWHVPNGLPFDKEWAQQTSSIYRAVDLSAFPTGLIDAVSVQHGTDGDIERVQFKIGPADVLLVPGEAHEEMGHELRFMLNDESVLAFANADEFARVPWYRP